MQGLPGIDGQAGPKGNMVRTSLDHQSNENVILPAWGGLKVSDL